jgi:hypothetical protein
MNEVQYFNRLQPSQFRVIFERAGFEDVRIDVTGRADLGDLKVSSSFDALEREDLECTVFRISARKPDVC